MEIVSRDSRSNKWGNITRQNTTSWEKVV